MIHHEITRQEITRQEEDIPTSPKRPSSSSGTSQEQNKRMKTIQELSSEIDDDDLESLESVDEFESVETEDELRSQASEDNEHLSSSDTDSELFVADNIVYEPTGGMIFDSEEACSQHSEFMKSLQWLPDSDPNNLLYPWKHEGEIWLTDLLFRKANISRATADNLLSAFANERISMADGPVQFTNSKEMIELLDIAVKQGIVSSQMFCKPIWYKCSFIVFLAYLAFSKKGFQHYAQVRNLDRSTRTVFSGSPRCYTKINVKSVIREQHGVQGGKTF
jgi:hypothetical protein